MEAPSAPPILLPGIDHRPCLQESRSVKDKPFYCQSSVGTIPCQGRVFLLLPFCKQNASLQQMLSHMATDVDGGVDEIISTRRLVHIAKAFSIFDDKMTAIDMCINRFDEDTKLSFKDLYTKIDIEVSSEVPNTAVENEEEIPF